ncbi:ankyrin repeat domain-containing protein [Marinicauda algicola]|uniref:Ankyrin repeat domain-containing protein n=1 Tax=Marinicauda algicola TaxID=2029849 RepID=A0A4V3RYF6_9PROT|nr:ankyrin repeat domain-containing protein [Marinicauda algicola]TGY90119.1 ankyrin repeat domain-containing protein [Marinicauda algicola]
MTQQAFFDAIAADERGRVSDLLAEAPGLAEARHESGVSAVLFALYRGRGAIAETIAARVGGLDVHELAALGRAEVLGRHLDDTPGAVSAWSADGFQPLHLAAFYAHVGAMRVLIARGADVDAKARHPAGMAPIHSAAASRRAEAVAVLLDAGAQPDAVQAGGFTALMSASAHGLEDMVEALLRAGAEPGRAADDARTAANLARSAGFEALAARLDAVSGRD